jgi:hypothetical protein
MDVINRMREQRQLTETRIKEKGAAVYATFTASEKTVVRFGMMPADKTEKALAELKAELADDVFDARDVSRLLSVAIMDEANKGPQKLVV